MSAQSNELRIVHVPGEGEIHVNLIPKGEQALSCSFEAGGAWQTARLLRSIVDNVPMEDVEVISNPEPAESELALEKGVSRVYNRWHDYDGTWRIREVLGITAPDEQGATGELLKSISGSIMLIQERNSGDLDPGLDFSNGLPEWIVFEARLPLFMSTAWKHVYEHALDRTILLLEMEDLRQDTLAISEGISWEKTVENLIAEVYLHRKPRFFALRACPYVLIRIGLSGMLLLENTAEGANCQLLFDAECIEWQYLHRFPGGLRGISSSLIAVVGALAAGPGVAPETMQMYARFALQLARDLHRMGGVCDAGICFPAEYFVEHAREYISHPEVYRKEEGLSEVHFTSEQLISMVQEADSSEWSLLDIQRQADYLELSKDIVRYGPEAALTNTPMCRMGHLLTIDRGEIESYRYLKKLMTSYLSEKGNSKPLSIAVFGFPGSGKSFGVKQIAKALKDDGYTLISKTFNLSQFNDPSELYQAFHQVRDIILSGAIPLIFWDEFDTQKLKWLRYFLAPMQDGQFQEGQLVHNVGEAVFIFAGGTCSSIDEFREVCSTPDGRSNKGPDFVSRLKGSISIKGPNPITCYQEEGEPALKDPYWMLRRAILLRSMLQMGAPSIFEKRGNIRYARIEDGVLHAFLNVQQYFHGARSIETILSISDLQGEPCFNRSLLPPSGELELHVDGNAFMSLVEEAMFTDEEIERMARVIHSIWTLQKTAAEGDDTRKLLIEMFDDLPLDEKRQNRTSARCILDHIRSIGLDLVPYTASAQVVQLEKEQVEELAQLEHQRWVRTHILAGWEYAPEKNKAARKHNDLIPWDDEEQAQVVDVYGLDISQKMGRDVLPDERRELDREIVRSFSEILREAGYALVNPGINCR